jgi:hypothetical protein
VPRFSSEIKLPTKSLFNFFVGCSVGVDKSISFDININDQCRYVDFKGFNNL